MHEPVGPQDDGPEQEVAQVPPESVGEAPVSGLVAPTVPPPEPPVAVPDSTSACQAAPAGLYQLLVAESLTPRYYPEVGQYAIRVGNTFVVSPSTPEFP